jgi:membrane fusion protein, macrolide-specific efflux system
MKGKNRRGLKLFGVLAAFVIVGAIGWELKTTLRPKIEPIKTAKVSREDLEVSILTTGLVQPENRLEIKPPIAGRAEQILVNEGDSVKRGQVLAWVSSTERAALLDVARARGKQELSYWEDLYKPAPLVAPITGLIIYRNVEPGQSFVSTDAVLVMSDRLIVKAVVDETDIGQIEVGQRVRIFLDAYPKDKITGQVFRIAYEAKTVSNVTTYEVDVIPDSVPKFMKSGMTANVTFVIDVKPGVLVLPAEAVHQESMPPYVFCPTSEGEKPTKKEVETGASDGKRIEIVSGLAENDPVVLPLMQLPKDGAPSSNPFSPTGQIQRKGRKSE